MSNQRPRTFIKRDVVEMVAKRTKLDPKVVAPIVDATFTSMRNMIVETLGECRIEIRDFGVLQVKNTAAKPKARNPRNPEKEIFIPARRKTHFRPGRRIKEALQTPLDELQAKGSGNNKKPGDVK